MAASAFERCGGFAAVRKIVSAFYDKILDSPDLQHYFTDIDMRRMIDHQTQFVASIMGGPASFTDEALHRVHAPLAITSAEFTEMAMLFREALEEAGLDSGDVETLHREVLKREMIIVTRHG